MVRWICFPSPPPLKGASRLPAIPWDAARQSSAAHLFQSGGSHGVLLHAGDWFCPELNAACSKLHHRIIGPLRLEKTSETTTSSPNASPPCPLSHEPECHISIMKVFNLFSFILALIKIYSHLAVYKVVFCKIFSLQLTVTMWLKVGIHPTMHSVTDKL